MREGISPTAAQPVVSSESVWKTGFLGDVISCIRGGFSVNAEDRPAEAGELGVLKTSAVLNGGFRPEEHKAVLVSEASRVRTSVSAGTIIICRKNSEEVIGASALVNKDYPNLFLSDLLWQITPTDTISLRWLAAVIASDRVRSLIRISSTGTQASMKNISQDRLLAIPAPIPPLPEQRKIAEILGAWEEALQKLKALRAAKVRRLDGLAAKLINDEQADRRNLCDFLREVSTRNRGQQVDRVLSVTNSAGFVLAEDKFAHRVASADLSNYKVVQRGQYAYNPSRINVGSIARLDTWDDGALSPMYVVFQVRDALDSDFFGHWLRSTEARQRIALSAQGSVRETVNFDDLGSILIPAPCIERQRSISRALNAARREINILDSEITALARQKRGLMQKLLTGEWRVMTAGAGSKQAVK